MVTVAINCGIAYSVFLQGHELLEFAREAVVPYLEDEDALTRRKAAVCCCRLVQHSTFTAGGPGSSRLVTHRNGRAFGMGFRKRRLLIEEVRLPYNHRYRPSGLCNCALNSTLLTGLFWVSQILEKLLVGAVADTDSGVRKFVLVALQENSSFDEYLAQADSLRAIFIALTDEVCLLLVTTRGSLHTTECWSHMLALH